METLTIEQLSVSLDIDLHELIVKVTQLNKKYKLDIIDLYQLNQTQYNIIRSLFEPEYLVRLLRGEESDRKYNYTRSTTFRDMLQWLSDYNLNGYSTKEVKESLPDHIIKCGMQTVAAAMRSLGYVNRMVYLDENDERVGKSASKKQGRRWFKEQTVSFM